MEIPMLKETTDIKGQFQQGPATTNTMPSAQELEERRKKQEDWLDANLPFLKKQEEYNRLKIALMESEVLLGETSVKQVPGLLGLELMMRELQANGYLSQWAAGQKDAMERAKQEKEMGSDLEQAEKAAKEGFEKLTPEEKEQRMTEAREIMVEKGLGDAYDQLNEEQKINIVMQATAPKQ